MQERLKLTDLTELDGAGLWVGAEEYSASLPAEDEVKYLIHKTQKGLWSIAIRGFNGGIDTPAEVNYDGKIDLIIDGDNYPAIGYFESMYAIDSTKMEAYDEAIREPEIRDDLLIQVLENNRHGVWNILSPVDLDVYEETAQLLINDTNRVGINLGHWSNEAETASKGKVTYIFEDTVAASLIIDGPIFRIKPEIDDDREIVLSSITERIQAWPYAVKKLRNLNKKDKLKLDNLNSELLEEIVS